MRKFKVIKCKQTRTVSEIKKRRDDNGNLVTYTVYSEQKAGEKDKLGDVWYPGAYGHERIKEGDIIELEGYRADKAANNPHFEEVKDAPVKKKRGRPPKVKAEANAA